MISTENNLKDDKDSKEEITTKKNDSTKVLIEVNLDTKTIEIQASPELLLLKKF